MSTVHTQWTDAERQEVIAEALHQPETADERAAQQARFQAWLKDRRYQHLWPMLERLTQSAPAPFVSEADSQPTALAK